MTFKTRRFEWESHGWTGEGCPPLQFCVYWINIWTDLNHGCDEWGLQVGGNACLVNLLRDNVDKMRFIIWGWELETVKTRKYLLIVWLPWIWEGKQCNVPKIGQWYKHFISSLRKRSRNRIVLQKLIINDPKSDGGRFHSELQKCE